MVEDGCGNGQLGPSWWICGGWIVVDVVMEGLAVHGGYVEDGL